ADKRIAEQLGRLEQLAASGETGDLKREVLATVLSVSKLLEDNRSRQTEQTQSIGARVHSLGGELREERRAQETDVLTRLFDRKAFDQYAAQSVELNRAFGRDTCLLLIDIDRFKAINEAFGRNAGDAVLCRLADGVMRTFFRKNDFVARRGG